MNEWKRLLSIHRTSDCKECLIEAKRLGSKEELEKFIDYDIWKGFKNTDDIKRYILKRLRKVEK